MPELGSLPDRLCPLDLYHLLEPLGYLLRDRPVACFAIVLLNQMELEKKVALQTSAATLLAVVEILLHLVSTTPGAIGISSRFLVFYINFA